MLGIGLNLLPRVSASGFLLNARLSGRNFCVRFWGSLRTPFQRVQWSVLVPCRFSPFPNHSCRKGSSGKQSKVLAMFQSPDPPNARNCAAPSTARFIPLPRRSRRFPSPTSPVRRGLPELFIRTWVIWASLFPRPSPLHVKVVLSPLFQCSHFFRRSRAELR